MPSNTIDQLRQEFPADASGYKILYEIGRGASAYVYKAICTSLNVHVAIKIIDLETMPGPLENSLVCIFKMCMCFLPIFHFSLRLLLLL